MGDIVNDVAADLVADRVGVPFGSGEQVLEAVGDGVAGVVGSCQEFLRGTSLSKARTRPPKTERGAGR
ncbi:hypothetical protein ACIBQX_35095 [Nonomuraea sp. NPDC049714]|uniref:hypothetical protein n=1 Tax=Nonomuraea sp. NPDC049714 TaxID=3364357 RepID=UPI0037AD8493